MAKHLCIIDLMQRSARDNFLLQTHSLRQEIIRYLASTCRQILPNSLLELHAEQIFPSEKKLVDRPIYKNGPQKQTLRDKLQATTESLKETDIETVLLLAPLQGPATANRIQALIQEAQEPGMYISALHLPANRHPAWQLEASNFTYKDYLFCRKPLKHIGMRQDISKHLRKYLPQPKDIKGSQYLPPIIETDCALMLQKGKTKYKNEPYYILIDPDLTDAPLGFRLPVFNLDQSIQCEVDFV